MRIRSIKPEFFKDEELAELDPLTRLFFIGLWCSADANGILENRPKRLGIEILPYDIMGKEFAINDMLSCLERGKWIAFFGKDGKEYIAIRNWHKHQRITGKESQSGGKFPIPSDDIWSKQEIRQEGNKRETPRDDPDAQEQGTGNREQGTGSRELNISPISEKSAKESLEDEFLSVWRPFLKFNRKGDKRQLGFQRFKECRKAGYSVEDIKACLMVLAAENKTRTENKYFTPFTVHLRPMNIQAVLEGEHEEAKILTQEEERKEETFSERIQREAHEKYGHLLKDDDNEKEIVI